MAKLGDLVVRIGADTRDLNKSLGKVQRNMRSMTSNFTALGTQMTKAITLPILGVGAMAIKSAADLEKMEVSFISLTGGAKQAADMMEQLNEFTAKTPFQIEAVATSARQLIASGTKISEVNEQLQFLGDIAATTGQPINEIAAIFAKVNAKGKVELENLNQLAERGVGIFEALTNATGLLPSELGAGRVSVQQFNAVLKSMSEEGGLAEGAMDRLSQTASGKFSTALDGLKLAGAALAEDLLPPINALLDGIVKLAGKFTDLSGSTKKIIIVVGTFLATLGPLLVVLPKIVAGITGMRAAIIGMNLALAANPVVLAATAIAVLTAAVVGYNIAATNAVKETRHFRQELQLLSLEEQKKSLEEDIKTIAPIIEGLQAEVLAKQKKWDSKLNKWKSRAEKERAREALAGAKSVLDQFKKENNMYLEELDRVNSEIRHRDDESAALTEGVISKVALKLHELSRMGTTAMITLSNGVQEFAVNSSTQLLSFLNDFKNVAEEIQGPIQETVNKTITAFDNLGESISNAFVDAIFEAQNFGDAIVAIGKQILKTLLSEAIANAISNASSSMNVANQASGGLTIPGFIAAAVGSVKAAFSNIPALKDGGIAFGPSLVEVGEYSGAGGNPEVIAPLNKLKDMIGGGSTNLYGRISGDDIVISNSRAARDRNRYV